MRLLRHREDVAVIESGDRVAILDLRALSQAPLVLEGTASVIWMLLDGTRTEGEVFSALEEMYEDTEPEVIARGLASFLGELEGQGLLTDASEASGPEEVRGA